MPSTPSHSTRLARALVFVGALALTLVVPVSAAHVACDHTDGSVDDSHHCAVCRHLDDGTPWIAALVAVSDPALVADLAPAYAPAASTRPGLPARGRSPPTHVSVS